MNWLRIASVIERTCRSRMITASTSWTIINILIESVAVLLGGVITVQVIFNDILFIFRQCRLSFNRSYVCVFAHMRSKSVSIQIQTLDKVLTFRRIDIIRFHFPFQFLRSFLLRNDVRQKKILRERKWNKLIDFENGPKAYQNRQAERPSAVGPSFHIG